MPRLSWLLALVTVLLLGLTTAALSADGPRISRARISLWPEYDEPRVLVMFEGTFDDKAGFPQVVRFRLPKGATVVETCAVRRPRDEHLCQLPTRKLQDDSLIVTYKLPLPDFFLEFYYNPVSGAGQRAFEFSFLPTYPIGVLLVEVQQPLRSVDFVLSPPTASKSSDRGGFNYHYYWWQEVPADEPLTLSIGYTKPDATPSVAKATLPDKPTGAKAGGHLAWVAVATIVAAAVALFAWLRRPSRSPDVPIITLAASVTGVSFCRCCGAPGRRDGQYCPQCAAQIEQ